MKSLYLRMRAMARRVMVESVDVLARLHRMSFPDSFIWRWRVEYLSGRYEIETTRFFKKHIKPGMVVIDVGANLGYFTRLFSRLVGPSGVVYAFEPDEENWPYLIENTKRFPNVKPFNLGVSDNTGTGDFYHMRGATGTHSLNPSEQAERRSISTTTLDDFVKSQGIGKVNAIKIDVEGAEDRVFAGMKGLLASCPVIVFEYTPDTSAALLEDLQKSHTVRAISRAGALVPLAQVAYRIGKRQYANLVISD